MKRLTGQAETYEKALAQVRANEETEKIAQADDLRDKAVAAFAAALKLFAKSDDPAEAEASRKCYAHLLARRSAATQPVALSPVV